MQYLLSALSVHSVSVKSLQYVVPCGKKMTLRVVEIVSICLFVPEKGDPFFFSVHAVII